MNFALLWKLKAQTGIAKDALANLMKTPYLAFCGLKPFEITFYLSDANSEFYYILSLWQSQQDLEKASVLFKGEASDDLLAGLQLVAQNQFQLSWEYCILPRIVGSSYLCVMKAPADLASSRFEEMKVSHRAYIRQVAGLNRVWTGQSLDTSGYTTLFRADWDSWHARNQFLGITTAAQQKRENYQVEGFEVEYALSHLLDVAETPFLAAPKKPDPVSYRSSLLLN